MNPPDDLGSIDARVNRLEREVGHHVHGRGWWLRLIAWCVLSLVVAFVFYRQQTYIDQLKSQREGACTGIVASLILTRDTALAGIVPGKDLPPTTLDANRQLRLIAEESRASLLLVEQSAFCSDFAPIGPPVTPSSTLAKGDIG